MPPITRSMTAQYRARKDAAVNLLKSLEIEEWRIDREADRQKVKAERQKKKDREFVLRDDKKAWVEYVEDKIHSCENAHGKENKKVIIRDVFKFCGETQYNWEINHLKFASTVQQQIEKYKLEEREFADEIEKLIAHRLVRII